MLPVMIGVFWEWLPRVVNIVPISLLLQSVLLFAFPTLKQNAIMRSYYYSWQE